MKINLTLNFEFKPSIASFNYPFEFLVFWKFLCINFFINLTSDCFFFIIELVILLLFQLTSSPFHVPFTNLHDPTININTTDGKIELAIDEHAPKYTFTFTISDLDDGVAGQLGKFTISPAPSSICNLSSSGEIEVVGLDYEKQTFHNFVVTVFDNAPEPFQRFTRYVTYIQHTLREQSEKMPFST